MRRADVFPDKNQALTIAWHLNGAGIVSTVREDGGNFEIWIHDEEQLEEGRRRIANFDQLLTAEPPDTISDTSGKPAEKQRKDLLGYRHGLKVGPVTLGLIIISVVIFLLGYTRFRDPLYSFLLIAPSQLASGDGLLLGLDEIRQGQVWRLITPILLHFHEYHILFNMLWLYQLGTLLELKESSTFFLMQVLTIGIGSNLAQMSVSGPSFGGMSGVVYGLFGYVWIRSKYDPWSGYYIHPTIVNAMLIWLILCFTGLLGPIANAAHVTGLALGAIWAMAVRHRPTKALTLGD